MTKRVLHLSRLDLWIDHQRQKPALRKDKAVEIRCCINGVIGPSGPHSPSVGPDPWPGPTRTLSSGQIAQHVVQNTAMLDIFDLDRGIDPAFQRDLFRAAIRVANGARDLGQRGHIVEAVD